MHLRSIQVGIPKTYGSPETKTFDERQWETGFFKTGITGEVRATKTGIVGDGQADLRVHDGPDKAICVYPEEHFAFWSDQFGLPMRAGAFGENFTCSGVVESEICIGDRFALSGTIFEVTQPRQPCWKLARRWGVKGLPRHVQDTGKTGWYFRVLSAGSIKAPTDLELIERSNDSWTIARCNEVMHQEKSNLDAAAELSRVRGLSESWKSTLSKRALKTGRDTERKRLEGDVE